MYILCIFPHIYVYICILSPMATHFLRADIVLSYFYFYFYFQNFSWYHVHLRCTVNVCSMNWSTYINQLLLTL